MDSMIDRLLMMRNQHYEDQKEEKEERESAEDPTAEETIDV